MSNKDVITASGHEDAQAQILRAVHLIQVLCDNFGYDPCEWLNDQTAIDGGSPRELRQPSETRDHYQSDVTKWAVDCFGVEDAFNRSMRCHRFLEEAVELVQAGGCSKAESQELIDYVYGRPVGQLPQEVGGVMVTLAALCSAFEVSMKECGDIEQSRIWQKFDVIQAKHKAKPKFGALPVAPAPAAAVEAKPPMPQTVSVICTECLRCCDLPVDNFARVNIEKLNGWTCTALAGWRCPKCSSVDRGQR